MKLKELVEQLKLKQHEIDDIEISPEMVVVSSEFKKSTKYRKTAVQKMINERLSFASEWNTFSEVAGRIIDFMCPYCEEHIGCKADGGASSGSISAYNVNATCKDCGIKVSLTGLHNAFSITFEK